AAPHKCQSFSSSTYPIGAYPIGADRCQASGEHLSARAPIASGALGRTGDTFFFSAHPPDVPEPIGPTPTAGPGAACRLTATSTPGAPLTLETLFPPQPPAAPALPVFLAQ